MKLKFEKDGAVKIYEGEHAFSIYKRILGESRILHESMMAGIPLTEDGGHYTLVNDDLSEIGLHNFGL